MEVEGLASSGGQGVHPSDLFSMIQWLSLPQKRRADERWRLMVARVLGPKTDLNAAGVRGSEEATDTGRDLRGPKGPKSSFWPFFGPNASAL